MHKMNVLGLFLFLGWMTLASPASAQPQVIELTQTLCQFVEPESGDHKYDASTYSECQQVNRRTGDSRIAAVEPLRLKAGSYIFRVTNENVPYELGFWLRGTGLGRLTLPSTSGGGLYAGQTDDYAIRLEPGKYVYSCPKNPTLDYPVIVE